MPELVDRVRSLLPTRADLKSYTWAPGRDLIAGITVALVALPLALAFGNSSGMGAAAGITTAVIAGIIAAVFGGSHLQVSGPTGAMAVVLIPIVASHGPAGVLVVGVMAGVLLLVMATLRLGEYARYVPLPVVEGFTAGIAVVIALQQVPLATGHSGEGESVVRRAVTSVVDFLGDPNWGDIAIALGTTLVILALNRLRPAAPAAIIAVIAATAVVMLSDIEVAQVGSITDALSGLTLPRVGLDDVPGLILPALAVALLSALESLLSATVADTMSPQSPRHDPNRELFGQGMANVVVPFFGGMPATAAIARTAVNVRSGARSRLASVIHSLVVLIAVLAAAPLVAEIPMAALAGVLFVTCARMVDVASARALVRAGRGETIVLAATALATVFFDLVIAVILGIVAAGAVVLVKSGKALFVSQMPLDPPPTGAEPTVRDEIDRHVVSFRIDGPLFFAAAHQSLAELTRLSDVRVVILRMSGITTLDATGASMVKGIVEQLERRGITVLMSGVAARHVPVLRSVGVFDTLAHEKHLFPDAATAAEHARVHVQRLQHEPGDTPR